MLRRLFALALVLGLAGAGFYYWKYRSATGAPPPEIQELGKRIRDTRITGEVKAAFGLNRALGLYSIGVTTEDGVVTLDGRLPSKELRGTAERVAGAVRDVRRVVDRIRVDPGSAEDSAKERTLGESLDDHTLEVQVHLALSLNRGLDGTNIEVQSFRREVTLRGEVDTAAQRAIAREIARETSGVEKVQDELKVRPAATAPGGAPAGEAERLERIRRALAGNANLKPYAIKVVEQDGRLVLLGRVRTGAEKDLAGFLAREAAEGPVDNALEVRP